MANARTVNLDLVRGGSKTLRAIMFFLLLYNYNDLFYTLAIELAAFFPPEFNFKCDCV